MAVSKTDQTRAEVRATVNSVKQYAPTYTRLFHGLLDAQMLDGSVPDSLLDALGSLPVDKLLVRLKAAFDILLHQVNQEYPVRNDYQRWIHASMEDGLIGFMNGIINEASLSHLYGQEVIELENEHIRINAALEKDIHLTPYLVHATSLISTALMMALHQEVFVHVIELRENSWNQNYPEQNVTASFRAAEELLRTLIKIEAEYALS